MLLGLDQGCNDPVLSALTKSLVETTTGTFLEFSKCLCVMLCIYTSWDSSPLHTSPSRRALSTFVHLLIQIALYKLTLVFGAVRVTTFNLIYAELPLRSALQYSLPSFRTPSSLRTLLQARITIDLIFINGFVHEQLRRSSFRPTVYRGLSTKLAASRSAVELVAGDAHSDRDFRW